MNYQQFSRDGKQIFLTDMRKERSYPFSEIVTKGIKKYLNEGKRIGILMHKKGFATGAICETCGTIPYCDACSVPIAFHKDDNDTIFGLCHICKTQYPPADKCNKCGSTDIQTYGLGMQQVAEQLQNDYQVSPVIVESSTANSPGKLKKLLPKLQQSQLIIGTSLLAQPHPDLPVDLWIVPMADMGIHIPDYQANRQNFLLLYELFSKQPTDTFLVQSYNTEHPAIAHACSGAYEKMVAYETERRKKREYPPYAEMCIIRYKHEIESRLFNSVNKLHQELLFLKENYEMEDMEIFTTPPLIYKIYHKYRYHIILKGSHLREFVDIVYSKLKLASRGFKIDREPGSITS